MEKNKLYHYQLMSYLLIYNLNHLIYTKGYHQIILYKNNNGQNLSYQYDLILNKVHKLSYYHILSQYE